MKKVVVRITFETEFYAEDDWSNEELRQVSEDLVGSGFPSGWSSSGLEEWGSKIIYSKIIESSEVD